MQTVTQATPPPQKKKHSAVTIPKKRLMFCNKEHLLVSHKAQALLVLELSSMSYFGNAI